MKYLYIFLLMLISFTSFATTHIVNSGMFYYWPNELTINVGDTVLWINDGGTHDVNGNISSITGNSFNNPESFYAPATSIIGATIYTHIFNIEGTYNYDCSVGNHALQGMVGSITVEGVLGCTNVLAINFNSNASIDNGSCIIYEWESLNSYNADSRHHPSTFSNDR